MRALSFFGSIGALAARKLQHQIDNETLRAERDQAWQRRNELCIEAVALRAELAAVKVELAESRALGRCA